MGMGAEEGDETGEWEGEGWREGNANLMGLKKLEERGFLRGLACEEVGD